MTNEQRKMVRRASRERDLDRRQVVAKPLSHTWGGKPTAQTSRRNVKQVLRMI